MQHNESFLASVGKTCPWEELIDQFTRWFGGQYKNNIAALIQHIIESGLDKRIYGSRSMDRLIISIYNPVEYYREAIHVTYNSINETWHFVYYALPFRSPEWVRTYPKESGILKFDQLISLLRW